VQIAIKSHTLLYEPISLIEKNNINDEHPTPDIHIARDNQTRLQLYPVFILDSDKASCPIICVIILGRIA
jgi:hypothetical protein